MRIAHVLALACSGHLAVGVAAAVTITNQDDVQRHLFVCDENCGPENGDDWHAQDFWIGIGESLNFGCKGTCFVGIYTGGDSPSLGDMAFADDDEIFRGDEIGYVRNNQVTHKPN